MIAAEDRLRVIEELLVQALAPESLQVEDESHLHIGHAGAKDGRGHFRVTIVSDKFCGQTMLARHRAVYEALDELLKTDIHALSIEAISSNEI